MDSGLLFVRDGRAVVTGDRWRLLIEINITALGASFDQLHKGLWNAQVEIAKFSTQFPELTQYLDEISILYDLISEIEEELDLLHEWLPPRKNKRGLFNLGGSVLKFVFGTPDADDLEEVRNQLVHVRGKTEDSLHLVEQQLSLSREMLRNTEKEGRRVSQLAEAVGHGLESARRQMEELAGNFNRTLLLLQHSLHISSTLRILGVGATEYMMKFRKVLLGVEQILEGHFNRHILSPRGFIEVLNTIKVKLPAGLSLITDESLDTSWQEYYRIADVKTLTDHHGVVAVVDLPLRAPGQEMEVYRVIPRPVQEGITGRLVVAETEGPYYFYDRAQGSYAILQEEDLQRCKGDYFRVCPAQIPVYHNGTPSCVHAVFLQNLSLVTQRCRWKMSSQNVQDTWIWDRHQERWAYGLPKSTRLHIQCRDDGGMGNYEKTISGGGHLELPAGCSVWTPEYRLYPMSTRNRTHMGMRWNGIHLQQAAEVKLTLGEPSEATEWKEEIKELLKEEESSMSSSLETWRRWSELDRAVYQLQQHKRRRAQLQWGGGVVGVLVLTILALLIGWRFRKRTRTTDNQLQQLDIALRESIEGPAAPEGELCSTLRRIHYPQNHRLGPTANLKPPGEDTESSGHQCEGKGC